MTDLKLITIFISSPSDLAPERDAIDRAVKKLNNSAFVREKFTLRTLRYEKDTSPAMGNSAQSIIDKSIPIGGSDLVLCIMWNKMGTPLQAPRTQEKFPSGTVYELTTAYRLLKQQDSPQIKVYRKTDANPQADPEQKALVDDFFKGFNTQFEGLYQTFESNPLIKNEDYLTFEDLAYRDIERFIKETYPEESQATPASTASAASAVLISNLDLVPDQPKVKLIGRDDEIKKVVGSLNTHHSVMLQGFSGEGKTAIAATIAAKYVQNGPILWLRAHDNTATDLFSTIARELDTIDTFNKYEGLKQDWLRRELAKASIKLFIVDDALDGEALGDILEGVPNALPVLVTSRNRIAIKGADFIEIKALKSAKAVELLQLRAGSKVINKSQAGILCQKLGNQAFSIELAGSALSLGRFTLAELIKRLDDDPYSNIPTGYNDDKDARSVTAMINATLDSIDDPLAHKLFVGFGGFPTTRVTPELMSYYAKLLDKAIDPAEALEKLLDHGLLARDTHTGHYQIHDLAYIYAKHFFALEKQTFIKRQITQACRDFVNQFKFDLPVINTEIANIIRVIDQTKNDYPDLFLDIMWDLMVGEE